MTSEPEDPEMVTLAAEFPGWRVWKRAEYGAADRQ